MEITRFKSSIKMDGAKSIFLSEVNNRFGNLGFNGPRSTPCTCFLTFDKVRPFHLNRDFKLPYSPIRIPKSNSHSGPKFLDRKWLIFEYFRPFFWTTRFSNPINISQSYFVPDSFGNTGLEYFTISRTAKILNTTSKWGPLRLKAGGKIMSA